MKTHKVVSISPESSRQIEEDLKPLREKADGLFDAARDVYVYIQEDMTSWNLDYVVEAAEKFEEVIRIANGMIARFNKILFPLGHELEAPRITTDREIRLLLCYVRVLSAVIWDEIDKGNTKEAKRTAGVIGNSCKAYLDSFRAKDDLEQIDIQ